jgi:hypothetical protein
MGRYICEVKRDHKNNELELVHANKYNLSGSAPQHGAIQFENHHELNKYFRNHCVSEDVLREEARATGNIFTFLFWLLLLVFIITMVVQFCNGKKAGSSLSQTSFGRFSF